MAAVEFFYDCSSPWTYLAFARIEEVCRRTGAPLVWKPILVGGVFNQLNRQLYEMRANPPLAKGVYFMKDLHDWARYQGLVIRFPPSVFPVNSVKAMRAAIVANAEGALPRWSERVFRAYFGEDRDVSQDDVLLELAVEVGLDGESLLAEAATPESNERLRAITDELIRRGGFGSPTIFVGDDLYFGNDRLVLVEHALRHPI